MKKLLLVTVVVALVFVPAAFADDYMQEDENQLISLDCPKTNDLQAEDITIKRTETNYSDANNTDDKDEDKDGYNKNGEGENNYNDASKRLEDAIRGRGVREKYVVPVWLWIIIIFIILACVVLIIACIKSAKK